jgi:hypothetical protein
MLTLYEKELEERLAAMQIQLNERDRRIEELTAQNDGLSAQLDELKVNCVYGFFTSSKRLFYAGRAEHFGQRICKHFKGLSGKQKAGFWRF